MTVTWRPERSVDASEHWLAAAADAPGVSGGLASLPAAVPAFFAGWVCLGLLIAAATPHRAADRRRLLALGGGLGPLTMILAMEAIGRRRAALPLVLAPGFDHGGDLDILVLVQDRPDDVRSLEPTLDAVAAHVGTVTVARAVPHLWLEADAPAVVDEVASQLITARDLLPLSGARLVVFTDTTAEAAARRFASRCQRPLVLHAIGEATPLPGAGPQG